MNEIIDMQKWLHAREQSELVSHSADLKPTDVQRGAMWLREGDKRLLLAIVDESGPALSQVNKRGPNR